MIDVREGWILEKNGYQRRMDAREGWILEKDGYQRTIDTEAGWILDPEEISILEKDIYWRRMYT